MVANTECNLPARHAAGTRDRLHEIIAEPILLSILCIGHKNYRKEV